MTRYSEIKEGKRVWSSKSLDLISRVMDQDQKVQWLVEQALSELASLAFTRSGHDYVFSTSDGVLHVLVTHKGYAIIVRDQQPIEYSYGDRGLFLWENIRSAWES